MRETEGRQRRETGSTDSDRGAREERNKNTCHARTWHRAHGPWPSQWRQCTDNRARKIQAGLTHADRESVVSEGDQKEERRRNNSRSPPRTLHQAVKRAALLHTHTCNGPWPRQWRRSTDTRARTVTWIQWSVNGNRRRRELVNRKRREHKQPEGSRRTGIPGTSHSGACCRQTWRGEEPESAGESVGAAWGHRGQRTKDGGRHGIRLGLQKTALS